MLETIRAYATERFAAAAHNDMVHERHYRHYLALAERHGTEQALWGTSHKEHLARLDADIDNVHTALEWAVDQGSAERALALCAALSCYWWMRNRHTDAVDWVEQALSLPGADAHPALRVGALGAKAIALWPVGRRGDETATFAEAEAVARELGDPAVLSRVLVMCAIRRGSVGRPELADALADEAARCAAEAGDDWAMAMAAYAKAMGSPTVTSLRERVDWAAALLKDTGNVFRLAGLLSSAAYGALWDGADHDAKDYIESAIGISRELDHPFSWLVVSGNLGLAELLTGDTATARDAFREELTLCRQLVVRPYAAEGLRGLAAVAVVRDNLHRAAHLVGAASAHRYGQPTDPVDARLDAAFFEVARARHGADAWDADLRDGTAMSFEDAIAYALEEPPE
jgi:hypothetical protein